MKSWEDSPRATDARRPPLITDIGTFAIPAARPEVAQASRHYNQGNKLLAKGKLIDAERAYRQALTLAPADAQAWSNLG